MAAETGRIPAGPVFVPRQVGEFDMDTSGGSVIPGIGKKRWLGSRLGMEHLSLADPVSLPVVVCRARNYAEAW